MVILKPQDHPLQFPAQLRYWIQIDVKLIKRGKWGMKKRNIGHRNDNERKNNHRNDEKEENLEYNYRI